MGRCGSCAIKFETRISKSETISKLESRNPKTSSAGASGFGFFFFVHSDLFRISTFGFRISRAQFQIAHFRIEPLAIVLAQVGQWILLIIDLLGESPLVESAREGR